MKKKHNGRGQPESSMMMKKPKLAAIEKPFLINESSCKNMKEELHQQETRTSEQVLQEKANLFDVNEASPMADLSTKHADISDIMSSITLSLVVIAASRSIMVPLGKGLGVMSVKYLTLPSLCAAVSMELASSATRRHIKKNSPN